MPSPDTLIAWLRRRYQTELDLIAEQIAEQVHQELNPTLKTITKGLKSIMTLAQDISTQANDISTKADENATAVNEAIALIEQLEVGNPEDQATLQAALDTLRTTSTELNDSTTRLAEAAAPDTDPNNPA